MTEDHIKTDYYLDIGHTKDEAEILLPPQIAKVIKPYQIGGIRFIYDNIIRNYSVSDGGGCVLAHAMGLGKTLQVVSFCDIFLRQVECKTVLCFVPINTMENWIAEFNKWLPCDGVTESSNKIQQRQFRVFSIFDGKKTLVERSKVIMEWNDQGGVLVMGYELFRSISSKYGRKRKRYQCNEELEKETRLMDDVHSILLNTDLVVCDEGHRIKNLQAETSVALKRIRTKRRIVLSGYPLQNNLIEYYCMVDFVRPGYLGSITEFCELFHKSIQSGYCTDASAEDVKLMRYRSFVMNQILAHIVQRRSHLVFKDSLPPITDYIILWKMTSLQRQLYDSFVNDTLRVQGTISAINGLAVCSKIFNHPDLLHAHVNDTELDWSVEIMKDFVPNVIENSPKLVIFLNLLQETLLLKERMLLFSHSLATLDLIETVLRGTGTNNITWKQNWNYFRIDGSCTARDRDKLINEFNANKNICLFLLSTKACSHGVNLVGANRVVLFDLSWNPCHEQQALCRVYRHEQTKSCFVYRLILNSCLEKRIYDRQVNKQGIAKKVVDDCNPDPHLTYEEMKRLYWDVDDDIDESKMKTFRHENYSDVVIQKIVEKFSGLMSKPPFVHDTLLTDNENTKLSENEKMLAIAEYKSQKKSISDVGISSK